EAKRLKRKGLNLEQEHVKKQKSSEQAPEIEKLTEEITEEKMKEMMQLKDRGVTGRSSGWEAAQLVISFS
nr:hypothetical protein [Tanacetum cinerariifolium]